MEKNGSCIVFGIGNPLHSDDGCGPYVADLLRDSGIPSYNCGTAPENFTGIIRKNHPHLLVLVDAALMNEEPGTLRIIPEKKIPDTAIGTHMLPLSHLVHYLSDAADHIMVIGIQPASLEPGDCLSLAVETAAQTLKNHIIARTLENIPKL
ncbi:MAG TPA: hydrogenase maturation peptidase HycI [Methanocorpusculum sp.]|nr:hydrogenase maturation peptidase HycI [Methanocorpusculum sp.]